jgi:hypothetical protein
LANRRTVIIFSFLRRVEVGPNILELAKHLRNRARVAIAKDTDSEVGCSDATFRAGCGYREFRPKRESAALGAGLPGLFVSPGVAEKFFDKRSFGRRFA